MADCFENNILTRGRDAICIGCHYRFGLKDRKHFRLQHSSDYAIATRSGPKLINTRSPNGFGEIGRLFACFINYLLYGNTYFVTSAFLGFVKSIVGQIKQHSDRVIFRIQR